MLQKAIEKIASMAANQTYEINGKTYSDNSLYLIEEPYDKPNTLELSGLDSVCDLIRQEAADFINSGSGMVIVNVDRYDHVTVSTGYDGRWRRMHPYQVKADVPRVTVGRYMSQQEAIIELRSLYIPSNDTVYLLNLLSRISEDSTVSSIDNGVTQRVEAKRGVSLLENVEIKPRVVLQPFRTFLEVDQPASEFLLRLDERGNVGLFEADGGVWKLEAKRSVAEYLSKRMENEIATGAVMVIR